MNIVLQIPDKNTKEIREAINNFNTNSEIEKMNAVCFWLISQCEKTNADSIEITQKKVYQFNKQLGDFKITVKKII